MKDQVIINGIEYVPKVVVPEPVKVGRWRPEKGDKYWYITGMGAVSSDGWDGVNGDSLRYALGNCYQTEELATQARDKQILLVELQDFADRANEGKKKNGSIWYIVFDGEEWDMSNMKFPIPGLIYCYDWEDIKAAIEHFGDRLNLLK